MPPVELEARRQLGTTTNLASYHPSHFFILLACPLGRERLPSSGVLLRSLLADVRTRIEECVDMGGALGDGSVWTGHLWDRDRHRL